MQTVPTQMFQLGHVKIRPSYFFSMTFEKRQHMKLGDLLEIRSGLVLSRKQSKERTPYLYSILTLRAIQDDGFIDSEKIETAYMVESLGAEYVTHPGDLVVRLTFPYTAVLISEATKNIVVPSNFLILRTKHNLLLPEYLYWFLNTETVRQTLYEQATSNMLGAIKKQTFVALEVTLPSLLEQEKFGHIYFLAQRENQLLQELAAQKKKYYSMALNKIYDGLRRVQK